MTPSQTALDVPAPQRLPRVLGPALLTFYGLGVIIGAGIYVLVGTVIGTAGQAAPWAFLLAGLVAGLTGLSYAELSVRYPEAAGATAFVKEGFGSDRLSQLTGLILAAVVIGTTASIARGSIGYIEHYLGISSPLIAGGIVLIFTGIACLGVRESVGLAALMTVIEIGGLGVVVLAGWQIGGLQGLTALDPWPTGLGALASGAFIAFFAFIGFENLANMAEEARQPQRSLPRAILFSLIISAVLYAAVTVALLVAVPLAQISESSAPLLLVIRQSAWLSPDLFAAAALIAVLNGVLIQLVMLGRLLFGMARRGWLPNQLANLATRLKTPVRATLAGGIITSALTVAFPLASLVSASSTITLLVFILVNLALWQIKQRRSPTGAGFTVPKQLPLVAALANLCLILAQALA
ncbi:APC family permease [Rhodoligotrophos ferricapiens]|uniref:APC family permease n=1 Tax=Rhodoligotrophos ferricapiens TaxID=3069264 RepID=UPI00315DCFAA